MENHFKKKMLAKTKMKHCEQIQRKKLWKIDSLCTFKLRKKELHATLQFLSWLTFLFIQILAEVFIEPPPQIHISKSMWQIWCYEVFSHSCSVDLIAISDLVITYYLTICLDFKTVWIILSGKKKTANLICFCICA